MPGKTRGNVPELGRLNRVNSVMKETYYVLPTHQLKQP